MFNSAEGQPTSPIPSPPLPNIRHSKATPLWGTPARYVALAREALDGRIELDPMSSHTFNAVVQAERIYTEYDDAFNHNWCAESVLLNPPGGQVLRAWRKLTTEYFAKHTHKAIWIGFSIEQLCQLADDEVHPMDFSWLLPRRRIPFVRHDGYIGSPSHSNYVVGMGMTHERFTEVFGSLGKCGRGIHALCDSDMKHAA